MYTALLPTFLQHLLVHMYADCTQLYISSKLELDSVTELINRDLAALRDYNLKIIINVSKINFVDCSRNMGLSVNIKLRFNLHVTSCIQKAYCKLRFLYIHKNYLLLI